VAPDIADFVGRPISKAHCPELVFIPEASIWDKHSLTAFESWKHLSSVRGQIPPFAKVAANTAKSCIFKCNAQH
jgi:hypothetical protein